MADKKPQAEHGLSTKSKWSDEEINVLQKQAEQTSDLSTSFWQKCATLLSSKFGTNRTSMSYRLRYQRLTASQEESGVNSP
ncbi:uncharacterized protein LOC124276802 isoform X2 [Haliotis rubra]|uniref:uncharacterized protein LOC124276802 isoform X2 n=1 Tax=Haliotis rubra TaxID=36100 RepID=UPI001EE5AAC1|nr:uncharacterized protein LOC124276802 isoform X2 [Haliotis rubra]